VTRRPAIQGPDLVDSNCQRRLTAITFRLAALSPQPNFGRE
jgi:hypothetical protein